MKTAVNQMLFSQIRELGLPYLDSEISKQFMMYRLTWTGDWSYDTSIILNWTIVWILIQENIEKYSKLIDNERYFECSVCGEWKSRKELLLCNNLTNSIHYFCKQHEPL